VRLKHVAATGFGIIQVVCRWTTSLPLNEVLINYAIGDNHFVSV
jgi:hypothetical protein